MPARKKPVAKNPKAAIKRRATRKANQKEGRNDKWEVELLRQLSSRKIPAPVREYRFDPTRRWRFDLAWSRVKMAVEIEGGIHIGGRHVTPIGFTKDCEKYNAAQDQGWIVLRYVPEHIKSGYAVEQIANSYEQRRTLAEVIKYGEEIYFGSGESEAIRSALDRAFAAEREHDKLAGLLIGDIDQRGSERVDPSEDGDH